MDATITTNIDTILGNIWTLLYGSGAPPTGLQPAVVMGYSGAGLSFVLTLAGAY